MKIHLDNSAFSLLACDWRAQLRVIRGIKEPDNVHSRFGSAVHTALELLDKGVSPEDMVTAMHNNPYEVDIPKVLSLVSFFKLRKRLPPPITLADGSPAVELKFSHKYASVMLPNQAELLEVYLEGTIDRIYLDGDTLVIMDYKTAADATAYQITKKLKSYSLIFQPCFYLFALLNFGIIPAVYLDYLLSGAYRLDILCLFHNTAPPEFKTHSRHAFSEDYLQREVPMIIHNKVNQYVTLAQLTGNAAHTGMTVHGACDHCGYRQGCLNMGTAREMEFISQLEVVEYNPLTFR